MSCIEFHRCYLKFLHHLDFFIKFSSYRFAFLHVCVVEHLFKTTMCLLMLLCFLVKQCSRLLLSFLYVRKLFSSTLFIYFCNMFQERKNSFRFAKKINPHGSQIASTRNLQNNCNRIIIKNMTCKISR